MPTNAELARAYDTVADTLDLVFKHAYGRFIELRKALLGQRSRDSTPRLDHSSNRSKCNRATGTLSLEAGIAALEKLIAVLDDQNSDYQRKGILGYHDRDIAKLLELLRLLKVTKLARDQRDYYRNFAEAMKGASGSFDEDVQSKLADEIAKTQANLLAVVGRQFRELCDALLEDPEADKTYTDPAPLSDPEARKDLGKLRDADPERAAEQLRHMIDGLREAGKDEDADKLARVLSKLEEL